MPCVAAGWKHLLSLIDMLASVEKVLTSWSEWLLGGACPGVIRTELDPSVSL